MYNIFRHTLQIRNFRIKSISIKRAIYIVIRNYNRCISRNNNPYKFNFNFCRIIYNFFFGTEKNLKTSKNV